MSKTQILVLDEATAAVDLQTDKLIQEAIKSNFTNLTVLTIAHRLNTIMEADKILVMDAGKVVEFAQPLVLLQRPEGHFTSLLKETGIDSFKKLKKIAEDKFVKSGRLLESIPFIIDHDNIIIDSKTGLDVANKRISTIEEISLDGNSLDDRLDGQSYTDSVHLSIMNENSLQEVVKF